MIEMHAACSRPRILLLYEQSIYGLAIDQGCAPAEWSAHYKHLTVRNSAPNTDIWLEKCDSPPAAVFNELFLPNVIYEQL
jgi:hypothetical protein